VVGKAGVYTFNLELAGFRCYCDGNFGDLGSFHGVWRQEWSESCESPPKSSPGETGHCGKLLRMFRGLYVTLNAFRDAMGSIAHLGTLLVTGLSVYSIFTTATMGHSERLRTIQMGSVTAEDWFGTVPRSMYSLFELMTLEGWDQVGRPLVEGEPSFSIFLFMFIMAFTFGLLNMIAAFVVERTMKQTKIMGELNRHECQKEVAQGLLQMKTIFEESDTDGI